MITAEEIKTSREMLICRPNDKKNGHLRPIEYGKNPGKKLAGERDSLTLYINPFICALVGQTQSS